MKIKSGLSICVSLLMSATLAGCSMDNDKVTSYFSVSLCNLIIPADESQVPYADSGCEYLINLNHTQATAEVKTDNLNIDGKTLGFTTDEMKYSDLVSQVGYSRKFNGSGSINGGGVISDFSGVETTLFYYYPTAIPGVVGVTPIDKQVILSYKVNDEYTVKTFPQDVYYGGETVTRFNMMGQSQTFSNKEPIYRIYFANDMKTATVVIYNVKFAEQMPALKALVLKDLDVTYSSVGFTITGEDLVASYLDGEGLTKYEIYPFRSFKFISASTDLVKGECNFIVENTKMPGALFYGSFTGSYATY